LEIEQNSTTKSTLDVISKVVTEKRYNGSSTWLNKLLT